MCLCGYSQLCASRPVGGLTGNLDIFEILESPDFRDFEPPCDHLGIILGSFWDKFGIILGSFWDHFGIILGAFWDNSGAILGPFWDHFGIILESF